MRLIGHNWDKFVALSAIGFVAVMCAAILTIYNNPYEQAINPVYQKQETAGSLVDQAVGEAVEKYLKVLNAEWLDKDCTLSHCSASSKAIPGVPDERSVFTKQERANLVGRDSERACFAPIMGLRFIVWRRKIRILAGVPGLGRESRGQGRRGRLILPCLPLCTALLLSETRWGRPCEAFAFRSA